MTRWTARLSFWSLACLCGAGFTVIATCCRRPTYQAVTAYLSETETHHARVAEIEKVETDPCGCPGPEEVCQNPCTACICRVMTGTVMVDEAERRCTSTCK